MTSGGPTTGASAWLASALFAALIGAVPLAAQQPPTPAAPSPGSEPIRAAAVAEPSDQPATFSFFNRPIVSLRARVLGRAPLERAQAAERILDDLVAQGETAPVQSQAIDGGALITVASRGVLVLTLPDIDTSLGQTLQEASGEAVLRLQQAIDAAVEGRSPRVLIRSAGLALLGLVGSIAAVWGIARVRRVVAGRLAAISERTITQTGLADLGVVRALRLVELERQVLSAVAFVLDVLVVYAAATFVLRRFPYTQPWGESMRAFVLGTVQDLGLGVLGAMPGLFTVLLIFMLARFAVRLVRLWLTAVEQGRVKPLWIHPETAQPTRRLLAGLLWLFAIVMAFPHLPGSETDAFRGVSVFLGLMLTLGSSGLVNQIMSGFMLTYSRALRLGDFVRIGDIEGTVTHLGVLSTKIRTLRREEVTVPNALVIAQTTTDYSRAGSDSDGVYTATTVTIGYDAPWRQVQSLLLLAAGRTPGVRAEPKPLVLQTALEDFYVRYTLYFCLERQDAREITLNALHASIQDLFNEHGVQIMSPNYVLDPAAPKLVPRKDWYAAPAAPEQAVAAPADRVLT
jgi:small-conductance mechanosensitive channel